MQTLLLLLCATAVIPAADAPPVAADAPPVAADALFINTWLVAGPWDNDADHAGFKKDWIGEATAAPHDGEEAAGRRWRYFDDRLFSRNLDDYQDLFSYWRVKQDVPIGARVAYAHVYVFSPKAAQGQLRIGADNACAAWLNGSLLLRDENGGHVKDALSAPVTLRAGWNGLLLKIANREAGRFGFYARLTDAKGKGIPGLVYSTDGGEGPLRVATAAMPGIAENDLPVGYRGWAYVGASVRKTSADHAATTDMLRTPALALDASDFSLTTAGGRPPYRWALVKGSLPEGLQLENNGRLVGTVDERAALKVYPLVVRVTDSQGASAKKGLSLRVEERPNKWYEESRLGALIHKPESLRDEEFGTFADLMKRQGYGLGFVISYNNGKHVYRWPSIYQPDNPLGDVVGKYKKALEGAGIPFGMYIGNLNGNNHNGDNGAILLVEDAIRKYRPAAFWFDWAGWNGVSLDALYSMIKSYDPKTIIVLNGIPTMSNGDWDVICFEGWGAWGDAIWSRWPFDFWWPKANAVESWRLIADPAFEYSPGVVPEWQEYMRIQVALICQGYIANIDHSPTITSGVAEDGKLTTLDDSIVFQAHREMAKWANPPGRTPLHVAYTQVNPGPFKPAPWGYNVLSTDRRRLYLHAVKTPLGTTGDWGGQTLSLSPVPVAVEKVVCMNTGAALDFAQENGGLRIEVAGLKNDPIDTIIEVSLKSAYPAYTIPSRESPSPAPLGNLATAKPARLMSNRGDYGLVASAFQFARYGVDTYRHTAACGAYEWDWTYHVDLEHVHTVGRIVIHFGRGFATEYRVLLSANGKEWQEVAHIEDGAGGTREHRFDRLPARYVRIRAEKPNGPNQPGEQMQIAELEAYAAE